MGNLIVTIPLTLSPFFPRHLPIFLHLAIEIPTSPPQILHKSDHLPTLHQSVVYLRFILDARRPNLGARMTAKVWPSAYGSSSMPSHDHLSHSFLRSPTFSYHQCFLFSSLFCRPNSSPSLPCAMGLRQSKEEVLYLRGSCGTIEAIRALHRDGVGLEWVDKKGKTLLIVTCSRPDGVEMARTLLENGANLNAYRPRSHGSAGSHAGIPLHHTTEKGLKQTVILLLSHGANVLRMNDDCQFTLDLARAKGHCNIVRNIEVGCGSYVAQGS